MLRINCRLVHTWEYASHYDIGLTPLRLKTATFDTPLNINLTGSGSFQA